MGIIKLLDSSEERSLCKDMSELRKNGVSLNEYDSIKSYISSLEGFYFTSQDHFPTLGLPYRKFEIKNLDIGNIANHMESENSRLELLIKDRGCFIDKTNTKRYPQTFSTEIYGQPRVITNERVDFRLGYQLGSLILEKNQGEEKRYLELDEKKFGVVSSLNK